jgi:hypothetical protein
LEHGRDDLEVGGVEVIRVDKKVAELPIHESRGSPSVRVEQFTSSSVGVLRNLDKVEGSAGN